MKYAVFNPITGETNIVTTKEEAMQLFWTRMLQFTLPHFHNTPYTIITENEDGSETWQNINGQEVDKPLTQEEMLNFYLQSVKNT